MVGWEKPVTRYNKTTTTRTITKICIVTCTRSAVRTYAGDQEWLNARGKKSLRSARWHLCSLSLASLLLDPTVACTLHFQQCYFTTIFTNIMSDSTAYAALRRSAIRKEVWSILVRGKNQFSVKMLLRSAVV